MRANNMTISIPALCNKDCPFCISKMTFAPDSNEDAFIRNLSKAKHMANTAQVSSILISSKGEPMNNRAMTSSVIDMFKDFPVELQTNGAELVRSVGLLFTLRRLGLNVLAVSIDRPNDFNKLEPLFVEAEHLGIVVRITVVLTDRFKDYELGHFIAKCHEYNIKQLTFRKATVPDVVLATESSYRTRKWISDNTKSGIGDIIDREIRTESSEENLIRRLPFGVNIYDIGGVAVTVIDYCIQEYSNGDDLRSLIYHQDGHMYTSWDKPGSILF